MKIAPLAEVKDRFSAYIDESWELPIVVTRTAGPWPSSSPLKRRMTWTASCWCTIHAFSSFWKRRVVGARHRRRPTRGIPSPSGNCRSRIDHDPRCPHICQRGSTCLLHHQPLTRCWARIACISLVSLDLLDTVQDLLSNIAFHIFDLLGDLS